MMSPGGIVASCQESTKAGEVHFFPYRAVVLHDIWVHNLHALDASLPKVLQGKPSTPATEPDGSSELLARFKPEPDEAILLRLATDELELHSRLRELELKLGKKALAVIDDSKAAAGVARVLKQVVEIDSAVTRKIKIALLGASTLRARRHFIERGCDDV